MSNATDKNTVPRSSWTPDEIEFDRIISKCDSPHQMVRVDGRILLHRFIEKHGKAACDAMWERIK